MAVNADKQWNEVLTGADGATIQAGPKAGTTTIEATAEAKQVLAAIARSVVLTHAQTGDGEWIEIARNGQYSLIVKSDTVGTGRYSDTNNFIAYNTLNAGTTTNLRYAMNNWYSNTLDTNARLRSFVVGHDALAKLGTWADLNAANGFSEPTGVAAGATDVAFPLSFQEAATYMSTEWFDGSARRASSAEAIANWNKLENQSVSWLRSPGRDSTRASSLYDLGYVDVTYVYRMRGIRPALWVETSIFD